MKIGLLSDTHGFLDEKIFEYFKECDEIWHAGDIGSIEVYKSLKNFRSLRAVYGNIDDKNDFPDLNTDLVFSIEGFRVWMTHIGGYPPRYNKEVKKKLPEISPDIFICGHSHILKIVSADKPVKLLYINPGAAGNQGFHKIKTLVRFTLADARISELQVIEIGKRS